MNNKGNIFEELNKMKGLIHAKAGTVISEQATANQLLASSKGFGSVTPEMADQLVKSGKLTSGMLGVLPAQASAIKDEARKELEKPVADAAKRAENIKLIYCSVKDGIITNPGSTFKNTPWEKYKTDYKVTDLEIADAARTCPANTGYKFGDNLSNALNIQGKEDTQKSNTQKGDTNAVNTRFTKSATDLGLQSGKMDLQTLQSILAKLQDDGSQSTVTQDTSTTTQPAGTTTQQTPDLTQLTSLLNQLNA
jgi:hypothetical protein